MRKEVLQAVSLIISSLALLYLLFINVYRDTFVRHDWLVVTVDLFAKTVIEIAILRGEKQRKNKNNAP